MKRKILGNLIFLLVFSISQVQGQSTTSWTVFGPSDPDLDFFAINPIDPAYMYGGYYNGVVKSTDGGTSWTQISFLNSDYVRSIVINPVHPDTLYVGAEALGTGGHGVYRSGNRGSSWTQLYSEHSVSPIAINPNHTNVIYAGTITDGYLGATVGLLKSKNSGSTWDTRNSGLSNLEIRTITIDPNSTNTIYVGTDDGLYKSVDSANTWSAAGTGLPSGVLIKSFAISAENSNYMLVGTSGDGLYKSTDGGDTWTSSGSGISSSIITSVVINPVYDRVAYVTTPSGGVYHTTDWGATWTIFNTTGVSYVGDAGPVCLNPLNPEIIYTIYGWGTTGSLLYQRLDNVIPPDAPTGLSSAPGDFNVSLTWTANTEGDFEKYRIYVGTSPNPTTRIDSISGISSTSKTISNLFNGVTYYLRITAVDTAGLESDYSNEVSATPVGLVAYYPFNGNINDESGNGNNGITLYASYTPDRFEAASNACYFNAASNNYIQIPSFDFTSSDKLTLQAWVKPVNITGHQYCEIIRQYSDFMLAFQDYGTNLTFALRTGGTWLELDVPITASDYTDGWHLITAVYDGSTKRLYMDGTLIGQQSQSGSIDYDSNPTYIGSVSGGSEFFDGTIDDIRLYNKALSESEIAQLYGNYHGPVDLIAENGDGQVTLRWSKERAAYIYEYNIYRDGVFIGSTTDTNYTVTGLTNYQNYQFFVTSNDIYANVSQPSDTITIFPCEFITDYDGNTYPTLKIGDQIWFQKNLNVAHYRNGTLIPNVTDNGTWSALTTGARCYYGNDSSTYADPYGALYNFYTVTDSLCPTGWHVPTDSEWNIMEKYLDSSTDITALEWSGTDIGNQLKSTIFPDGTNTSGFSAYAGGYRVPIEDFLNITQVGYWWTSKVYDIDESWMRHLHEAYSGRYRHIRPIKWGLSVRCLQGETPPPTITSFAPEFGSVGTTVTITGTNFSYIADNNIVRFGAVRGSVTSASATQLVVTVPTGATFQPITMTDSITGLTAFSRKPFITTFLSSEVIDTTSFAGKVDFVSGTGPHSCALGDIDGDGKPDLVVANYDANTVSVLLNTGTTGIIDAGTFASPVNYSTGTNPALVTLEDIDGDGKVDLLVTNLGSNTLSILRNTSTTGAISFAAKVDFTTGTGPLGIGINDFDGDGKPDIAVANTGSGNLYIFRNTSSIGSITLATPGSLIAGSEPHTVAASDFDGDGKIDLAVANYWALNTFVYRNTSSTGSISFDPEVAFSIGSNLRGVTAGDLDSDGKPDIVSDASIFRNISTPGNIACEARVDFTSGGHLADVAVTDLDGDGKLDIVLANFDTEGGVSVIKNNTTTGTINSGSFQPFLEYATGQESYGVTIGDIDLDGKPDLVVANYGASTVSVLRNTVSPPSLVAYYPFNGNANDESGYGNNGTENGGLALTTDRFGNDNSAYSFNGVFSYITTMDHLVPAGGSDYSISLWFNSNTISGTQEFLSQWTNINSGNSFYLGLSDQNIRFSDSWNLIPVSGLSVNRWYNLTAVSTGSNAYLYLNGMLVATKGSPLSYSGLGNLLVGRQGECACEYTNGIIDDIRIYNRIISESEILQLYANYNAPVTVVGITTQLGQNRISWSKENIERIEKYKIFRDNTLYDSVLVNTANDTLFLDTTITPGTTYQYYITSVDTLGNESIHSDTVIVASINYFTDMSEVNITEIAHGSAKWGDYDKDGDLDILLSGQSNIDYITNIFRNDGSDTFTMTSISMTGLEFCSVDLGDFDNDGDLDIMIAGYNGSNIFKIYRNDGSDSFTETGFSLPGVFESSVVWGDYDNDGDLDILLTGYDFSINISKIYRNDGGNSFTETDIPLTGVYQGSVHWGDYDNDEDLDILMTGSSLSKIYRNDGDDIFTETDISLAGIIESSADWGDYDNDGDLDILLSGNDGSGYISKIYRNDGSDTFTETGISIPGVYYSSVQWGDYDNDGDLDILLSGNNGTADITRIYRNDGGDSFNETSISLQGVSNSSVKWGDYDNDGDLDILITGSYFTRIYRNNLNTYNNAPAAPANLSATPDGVNVTLSWNAATDTETPSATLTYNVRVGTTPGGFDIVSPHALSDGKLTVPGMGNAQLGTSFLLRNLAPGKYYWSVQAVDNGFVGGAWATEGSFTYQGCAVYYPLDGNANDISGNGNDGTPVNISFTEDRYRSGDYAAMFAADLSATIQSSSYNFSYTDQLTIQAWVKPGNIANYTYGNIVRQTIDFMLAFQDNGTNLTFAVSAGSTWQELDVPINTSDYINSWHLVTAVYNGSVMKLYVDANLIGEVSKSGNIDYGGANTFIGSLDGASEFFDGVMEDVRIYNQALSQSDIMYHYSNLNPPRVVVASSDEPGKITLHWSSENISRITKYRIYRDDALYDSVLVSLPLDIDTLYTDVNVTLGVPYSYYITSVDTIGNVSMNSETVIITSNTIFSNINAGLISLSNSWARWGDYDNDGDLDVLVIGMDQSQVRYAKIYRNDGNDTFTEQAGISLSGLSASSSEWGDYDNDGDLDILLTGHDGTNPYSLVYTNNGDNTFTLRSDISLTGTFYGSGQWGDYNNDGRLDIVLSGCCIPSLIYRNDGIGNFNPTGGLSIISSAYRNSWNDFDGDNDLDLLLTGNQGSKIYRNNGDNTFTEIADFTTLIFTSENSVSCGDYDNDGDIDILLSGDTGESNMGYISKVYQNNGNFSFIEQSTISLTGSNCGSSQWGDYDNDGYLDILLSGDNSGNLNTIVYRNNGDNTFTPQDNITLPGTVWGSTQWGDYDNDGDLDILITGASGEGNITSIYRNNLNTTNTQPTAPANLNYTQNVRDITFTWDAATDDKTPSSALSYNIRVGSSPGAFDIVSPHALANGQLTNPGMGNAQLGTTYLLKRLAPGTYYWSVQAVDNTYTGGEWAAEQTITVTDIPLFTDINVPFEELGSGTCSWGDYDKDGDLDILLNGYLNEDLFTKVYRNDGNDIFTNLNLSLQGTFNGTSTWGDYDNDGDLDMLLTGWFEDVAGSYKTIIYRNDGGTFTDSGIQLADLGNSDAIWGDYNRDGLLDILIFGESPSGVLTTKIYKNWGGGNFEEQTNIAIPAISHGSAAWGDYDNDNDLDLLISGWNGSVGITKIFRNDGDNIFTEQTAISLTPLYKSAVAWGDYNGDGCLDFVLTGLNNSGSSQSVVYLNNTSGNFTEQTAIDLVDVFYGGVSWGDYNNDGDLDLMVTGSDNSVLYDNNGDGTFTVNNFSFVGTNSSSCAWGDYDSDGDLDMLTIGGGGASKVYRNERVNVNRQPGKPTNLQVNVFDRNIVFTWDVPVDAESNQASLTYNIRVGTYYQSIDKVSPHSLNYGKLTVPAMGNAQHGTSYYLNNTSSGYFYWSVQAVDNGYLGGDWSDEATFFIPDNPSLISPVNGATGISYRPKLEWSVPPGAEEYLLQVSASSTFASTVYEDSTITDNYQQVGPLAANRTYYWRVKTKTVLGWGEYSPVGNFKVKAAPDISTVSIRKSFTSPGSKPTGLTFDGKNLWMIDDLQNVYKMDTSGNVLSSFAVSGYPDTDLSWDGTGLWIGGGTHYKVDTLGSPLDTFDVYYWWHSGLEWDGKYFWIGNYNSGTIHKHKRDGTQMIYFDAGVYYGHPTGITYDGSNLWVVSIDELIKDSPTGEHIFSYDLASSGLPYNGSFKSIAWDGESLWYGDDASFTIYRLNVPYYHSAPSAPTLISPVNDATDQSTLLTFSWTESTDATNYRLQIARDADFSQIVFDDSTITTTSKSVGSLVNSMKYYWRVRAKCQNYYSEYTLANNFTTVIAVPATPSLISPADGAISLGIYPTLEWSLSSGDAVYHLQVATDNSFSSGIILDNQIITGTTWSLSNLNHNQTYYWHVRAYNGMGSSDFSPTYQFTTGTGYFVDAVTGNNSTGDGSQGNPWKTITHALGQMSGMGQYTVHVAAGTYNAALGESFPIFMVDSVSLIGIGKDVTIIDAGSSNTAIKCIGILDPNTRLVGFTITNGISNASAGAGGIYVSSGSLLHISNNLITANRAEESASGGAIYILNASPQIEGNTITANHGQVINQGACIYVSGAVSAPLISGNTITGNINDIIDGGTSGAGTIVINGASGTQVRNNLIISNNPGGGYYSSVDGAEVYIYNCSPAIKYNVIAHSTGNGIFSFNSASSPTIENNTISDNTFTGISIFGGSPASITNNIITFNQTYGIEEGYSASDPVKVTYNLFYQNGSGLYYDEGTTAITSVSTLNSTVAECKNNLSANPFFVDRVNNNYHLGSSSMAINQGDPNSPLDPDGTRADLGAFYYESPPSVPQNLIVAGTYNSRVDLTWTSNTDSDFLRYRIYGGTSSSPTTKIDSTDIGAGNNSISITGLTNGTTYYFRITAVDVSGAESAYSNEVSAVPNADQTLIAYYPFNGDATDYSGNGNNGTSGSIVSSYDRFNTSTQALYFDGTNPVEVPSFDLLSFGSTNFTFAFWFTLDDIDRTHNGLIGRNDFEGVAIEYNHDGDRKLYIFIDSDGASGWEFSWQPSFTGWENNRWYHLALLRDGNMLYLYINGVLADSNSFDFSVNNPSGTPLYIGRSQLADRTHSGKMDEVRIYNAAITNTEIRQLYANYYPPQTFNVTVETGQNVLTWDSTGYGNLQKVRIFRNSTFLSEVAVDGIEDTLYYDTQVTAGTNYSYFITSVDKLGYESNHSNTITVILNLSNNATISSTVYTVDNDLGTITNIPMSETLENFKINLTPAIGATFEVYQSDGITIASDLQTGYMVIVTAQDGITTKGYNITLNSSLNSETNIISFNFAEQTGPANINPSDSTITIEVAFGTELTNLIASFTISSGASIKIGSTPQVSGVTANDFTSPVIYTVVSEDEANTENWTVTVTVKPNSDATLSSSVYTVDNDALTITNIPRSETLENFNNNITPAEGATFEVYQSDGVTVASDLQTGYLVIVTAQDGVTVKTYSITVNASLNTEAKILTFSFVEQFKPAIKDTAKYTVDIMVVYGTDTDSLIATFSVSTGASVKVGSTPQISGITANNFTSPVTYTVVSEDGATTINWTVTVTVQPITPIYDIQYTSDVSGNSPYMNKKVVTGGIVTSLHFNSSGAYNGFFIQDGTVAYHGIYVYTPIPVEPGDSVIVSATVGEYYSFTELFDVTKVDVKFSQVNILNPITSTIADLTGEAYESMLVKVNNASCVGDAEDGTQKINDGTGTLYTDDDIYAAGLVIGNEYNITGIIFNNLGEIRLLPRSIEDIVDITNTDIICTIPAGSSTLCQGTAQSEYTTTSELAETYEWELIPSDAGTVSGTGATGNVTWEQSFTGTAGIRVRGINGNINSIWSDYLNVTVNPTPGAISIAGQQSVCLEQNYSDYWVPNESGINYDWSVDLGTIVSGQGTNKIYVNFGTSSGSGYVTLWRNYSATGCYKQDTKAIDVINSIAPQQPDIHKKGRVNILICLTEGATAYQWYQNGWLLNGATKQFYVARDNIGDFQVEITNSAGCKKKSEVEVVTAMAVLQTPLALYPNPTSKELNLDLECENIGRVKVSITDSFGTIYHSSIIYKNEYVLIEPLDIRNLNQGIYFVTVEMNGVIIDSQKLIVI